MKSTTIPLASRAGYPLISVPAGFDRRLPLSLFFFGTAYSEPSCSGSPTPSSN